MSKATCYTGAIGLPRDDSSDHRMTSCNSKPFMALSGLLRTTQLISTWRRVEFFCSKWLFSNFCAADIPRQ